MADNSKVSELDVFKNTLAQTDADIKAAQSDLAGPNRFAELASGVSQPRTGLEALAKVVTTGLAIREDDSRKAKIEKLTAKRAMETAELKKFLEGQLKIQKLNENLAAQAPAVAPALIKLDAGEINRENAEQNLQSALSPIYSDAGFPLQSLTLTPDGQQIQVSYANREGKITNQTLSRATIAQAVHPFNPDLAKQLTSSGMSKERPANLQLVDVEFSDGGTGSAFMDPRTGDLIDINGKQPITRSVSRINQKPEQIIQGTPEQFRPTDKTQNTLQQSILDADAGLVRIDDIARQFDAEFLTAGGRTKSLFTKAMDFIDPKSLSKEDKDFLTKRSTFMQDAAENINLYIKAITGAQVSVAEAGRLSKAQPDPEKDSPTEFKAKLENSQKKLQAAKKRAQFLLEKGLQDLPIDSVAVRYPLEQFEESPQKQSGKGQSGLKDLGL